MSGSGGGTQAGGPAPAPLLNAENRIFGSMPWANINQASPAAYSGIQGLNTNPAAQYGPAATVGQNLTGVGGQLAAQAPGAYAAGQDPQNALYAKLFQQQQDQQRATNAANGVAATPYGASLETQGNQNFNLGWQNNLLQRENTAASTASTLAGAGGGAAQTGLGIGQSIDTQQYNAKQQQIMDYIQYLLGNTSNSQAFTGAANNTYGAGVNAAGISNQAAQASNSGLLSGLSGLGSLAGSALAFL